MKRLMHTALLAAATFGTAQTGQAQEHKDDAPRPVFGAAVDDATLQQVAGREDTTQISRAEQVAGVSRNSVGDNSVTGTAQIGGNAFQNMSGLSILNINTGNNVAINAAMNVNIALSPGQ